MASWISSVSQTLNIVPGFYLIQRLSLNKKITVIEIESRYRNGRMKNYLPKSSRKPHSLNVVIAGLVGASAITLSGQEIETDTASSASEPMLLPEVSLIGSEEAVRTLPASGAYIGEEQLRKYLSADVNRVLRQVPGVYLREEDGMGLFPNVSIRGVTTERSKAVTVMEDGILSAPAPYSAPSAYYSPNVARMNGLEILKGSSQIKYGPHITGGAINYLSTPIPADDLSYLKLSYGSYNELIGHFWHGNVKELENGGRVGYLVEGFYHTTDGFKDIDTTPDFSDGEDTGFTRVEPMVKVFWELPTETYHRIEAKYGYSDLDADETYLGLSETDFDADPFRRYSASRFDNIQTENHRASLRHIMEPRANLRIATTGYMQHFERNWAKLHQLRGPNVGLSSALLDASPGGGLAILNGTAAGTLRVRNNAREYKIYGIQTSATATFDVGDTAHKWETGIRYHFDEVDRFQWDVDYVQAANGTISGSTVGAMGAAGDRIQQSHALALFTQDEIKFKRWTLTPGIRFETIDQEYEQDQRRADGGGNPASGDGRTDAYAGGLSIAYELNSNWNAFFGVHRGFSVPGPRAAIRSSLDEETSLSFELGSRYTNPEKGLMAEAVLFRTDFNDLIVGGNLGGGGAAVTENVGDIDSMGLELALAYDHGQAAGWAVRTPARFALTLTDAELDGAATNTDPESLFEGGTDGADVPYIPDYQLNAEFGLEYGKLGAYVSMTYVPATYTSASNTSANVRADGTPDARVGETDSYFLTDLSVRYQLKERTTIFGGIRNLFDREYVASRHPHGPRPGLPRFFNAGVEIFF